MAAEIGERILSHPPVDIVGAIPLWLPSARAGTGACPYGFTGRNTILAGAIPTKMSVSNPALSAPESERGYVAMSVLAPAVCFGQRVQSRDALCVGEDYV